MQLLSTRVEQVGDHYRIDAVVMLNGELDPVIRLLSDYGRFAELSPTVVGSRVISGRSGRNARIEVRLRPCVLVILCRTVTKVSDVRIESQGRRMRYDIVPGPGDFREGIETITLTDKTDEESARVRFVYSAVLTPKFFVPPFVGTWLIRRQIGNDLEASGERLERMLQDSTAD